jgi:hypothetical protein
MKKADHAFPCRLTSAEMNFSEIIDSARTVFSVAEPPMTLRQGNDIDSYKAPGPKTPEENEPPTDQYLESYHWGVTYLDPTSWRFYLPHLISYSLRNLGAGESLVFDALLQSLRPPDREPARLATVTEEEEKVIVSVLDVLSFDPASKHQREALQVLEEYWIPNAIYRNQKE